jgi:hypothetical protein
MNGMKDSGSEVSDSGLKTRALFIGLRLYHAPDNLSEQRQILKVVANLKWSASGLNLTFKPNKARNLSF